MTKETALDLPQVREHSNDPVEVALRHLREGYAGPDAVAVVIGLPQSDTASLLQRFLRTAPRGTATALIETPSDSPHAFLESVLLQFGFEPFDSSVADLQNLIAVYLRHECAQGNKTIITVEATQDCGPRVLDLIQELTEIEHEEQPTALFVLTGTPDLARVLDSAPMIRLANRIGARFTNKPPKSDPSQPDPRQPRAVAECGEIEICCDGRVMSNRALDRNKLIVGRSEHNDLSLASRFISRHHALLVNEPDGAYVVDLKSKNGTFVNSTRIEQQSLKHGDVISIGSYRLTYLNPGRGTAAPIVEEDQASFADTVIMQSLSGEHFES